MKLRSILWAGLFLMGNSHLKAQSQPTTTQNETIVIEGIFESKQGVMTPLSCYCGNGGYVTTADGKQIAVCFEGLLDAIPCKKISIKGIYKTVTNSPEPTNPCPKGEMTYLKVLEFRCLK